jgi:hypothetical protein
MLNEMGNVTIIVSSYGLDGPSMPSILVIPLVLYAFTRTNHENLLERSQQ